MTSFENRVKGLFFGIAIGDAKGIPYEGLDYEKIQERFNPNEIYSKMCNDNPKMIDHPPAKWTDDTQLTIAVAKSIIEAKGFNMDEIGKQHVLEWKESTVGWGSGTRTSVEKISNGVSPLSSGNIAAKGNGVIMKIAPLALYYSCTNNKNREQKLKEIESFARMTHDNVLCVVTACFYCFTLEKFFRLAEKDNTFFDKSFRKIFLQECIAEALSLEQQFNQKEELVSERLKQLLYNFDNLSDQKLIEISSGGNYFVLNSLTMVFGLLFSQDISFELIIRAVTIGGDTDSNASMVGAVVGAIKGFGVFPTPYIEQLYRTKELLTLAIAFSNFCKLRDVNV